MTFYSSSPLAVLSVLQKELQVQTIIVDIFLKTDSDLLVVSETIRLGVSCLIT